VAERPLLDDQRRRCSRRRRAGGAHGLREAGDRVVYVGANKPNGGMTNAMTGSGARRPATCAARRSSGRTASPQCAPTTRSWRCITVHKARKVGVR
jgi:hypothetical protein